jgi:hypothetical protein
VRSTLGQHLVDVASSDHHTVKPFLSSKLDFSPPVNALQIPGSVFVGGRVDYLDGRPVAALVYGRASTSSTRSSGRACIRQPAALRGRTRLPDRALGRRRDEPLGHLGRQPRRVPAHREGSARERRGCADRQAQVRRGSAPWRHPVSQLNRTTADVGKALRAG